ncbi:FAD binding domain-containing protein [Parasporobacterium paucivorans]|uniref:CO or xanthine dehydrogenase, FAD-binding subunit n=1 Tax=Parasporobacterium paucivorans DSM 15970 TaxID=1122934 RepID=A0A1M6C5J1_9FIRM|nr:FAD binding domain-containing protein [Parasporobacterium paucivorans]SHI56317.1 CO or xanthine dehydrogenase, FAD-binding subunit [Parasporobacterium paucivorans DSM 15970]
MVEAYFPENLPEALRILGDEDVIPYAGGTDIMVGKSFKKPFLYLDKISELKKVENLEGKIRIGACSTYAALLRDERIPKVLKESIRQIASPSIRNLGTIGGNICNASPAGDTLPILYALNAYLRLESENGFREIPIREFITGVKKTARETSWLLTEIIIPSGEYEYSYQKVGARRAQAIAKLSFVGIHELTAGIVSDIRIAFGAVGTTVLRDQKAEKELIGKKASDIDIPATIQYYEKIIRPIDDQRSEAVYRKTVCLNILREYLENELTEGNRQ